MLVSKMTALLNAGASGSNLMQTVSSLPACGLHMKQGTMVSSGDCTLAFHTKARLQSVGESAARPPPASLGGMQDL